MDVSVIIINFNTLNLTCGCIQSIHNFTKDTSVEIILVDNASSEQPADNFTRIFPEITLVKSSANVGFSRGNNLGIEQAKGRYILLLNSDAELLNDGISITYQFLEQNPDVAVATGKLMYPDGRLQHNCQRFPSIRYQLIELLRLQKMSGGIKKKLFGSFFNYNEIAYPDWVWGTFFMFKKDLLNELPNKKLADDFFMYSEDMQWCKDFRLRGYKTVFLPQARIKHLMGGSGAAKNEMMKANDEIFLRKYYSWPNRMLFKILKRILNRGHD
jgi:GT2 family glycosyltransferase